MADASCSGPSPFKRLVDHQTRDASHHQDRLTDRSASHSPGSFRSAAPPGAHAQENFLAFTDGTAALPGVAHDPAGRLAAHAAVLGPPHLHQRGPAPAPAQLAPHHQARASPAPDVSNWAADFQRFSGHAQGRGPLLGGQPQGFLPGQVNQPVAPLNFQAAFGQPGVMFPPMSNGGLMAAPGPGMQQPTAQADFDQEMSRWMANYGGGANSAQMKEVDAMMDQVASELEMYEAVLPQTEASTQATTTAPVTTQGTDTMRFTDLETPEIGNLSLEPREEQPAQVPLEEETAKPEVKAKSAVSEAAEKLLESVQHEDGEKWQNSVFLSLMRDFRDGRKDIIDNEIRQTSDTDDSTAKTVS